MKSKTEITFSVSAGEYFVNLWKVDRETFIALHEKVIGGNHPEPPIAERIAAEAIIIVADRDEIGGKITKDYFEISDLSLGTGYVSRVYPVIDPDDVKAGLPYIRRVISTLIQLGIDEDRKNRNP